MSVGAWVERDWSGGSVYGKIRDRTKDSFTVDGNTVSGDDGEPVYKFEEYDTDSEDFTGQMIAAPESGLSKWSNAPSMSQFSEINEIYREVEAKEFEEHDGELDEVYSNWDDAVNMTDSQMTKWSDHPCADTASRDPEAVRQRNKMLLGTPKSEWDSEHIEAAKRTVSFISRMRGQRPDSPAEGGKGTCPSEWAVSLLNWAYNPFDSLPDGEPNPEQENSADDADDELRFSASAVTPERSELVGEFSEHGIRKNHSEDGSLESVDAVFEAMEPGPPDRRNGVRITENFLKSLADKEYDDPPFLMDHQKATLSKIGEIKDVWYSERRGKLMLMARAFNTGADTHDEVVSRLTHDPPTITDGSVGLGNQYSEVTNDDGERELEDGFIREFSTTPFPAGYDDGGLSSVL